MFKQGRIARKNIYIQRAEASQKASSRLIDFQASLKLLLRVNPRKSAPDNIFALSITRRLSSTRTAPPFGQPTRAGDSKASSFYLQRVAEGVPEKQIMFCRMGIQIIPPCSKREEFTWNRSKKTEYMMVMEQRAWCVHKSVFFFVFCCTFCCGLQLSAFIFCFNFNLIKSLFFTVIVIGKLQICSAYFVNTLLCCWFL